MVKPFAGGEGASANGLLGQLRNPGCLLLVGALLAVSLVIAKGAAASGAPLLSFLTASMVGAGSILAFLAVIRRQAVPLNRQLAAYGIISGALFALPNGLAFFVVPHAGAAFVSLSFAFPVLLTWILAVLLKMESISWRRTGGVLLGLSGGFALAIGEIGSPTARPQWMLAIVAIPVVIAMGNVYRTLRWPVRIAPLYLAALMMFGGALTLLPIAGMVEGNQWQDLSDAPRVYALLLCEIIVFAVLYIAYFLLQKWAGPVYFSQIGTVAAVIGAIIGILLLGEPIPPNLGVASLFLIGGMVLFHRHPRRLHR